MITLFEGGAYLLADGKLVPESERPELDREEASKNTMAYEIMQAHNTADSEKHLKLKFDAMASHDITYVGIVQTARASGLKEFPMPYVLTNCHNSLCAVGGTINEDDHLFGLSAAKKYGGIYVPAHQAVIHQYMREKMAGCGKMILGSDSHTRYGALGTMAIGEGGGELAKQLLRRTYDVVMPEVVAVYLTGEAAPFVGPQDVALAVIGKVFENGYVKNKVMEFVGGGIKNLGVEFRNGIDVMTTETTCLSSIWATDEKVKEYYEQHGRGAEYRELKPKSEAWYSGAVVVDLSKIRPMIALPFHPSNVYTIDELNRNLKDIIHDVEEKGNKQLDKVKFSIKEKIIDGKLMVDQGVIAGCAGGTFDNICDAADILDGFSTGAEAFSLSVYPSSQPTFLSLVENGAVSKLMAAGATIRSAFCGPCFGAGDVPSNNGFSIRHSTRNFPNREGSKPANGQIASVALMDARSIAATARNKGVLTSAEHIDFNLTKPCYCFKKEVYDNRVYDGYGKAELSEELKFGPNIVDWPQMGALTKNIVLQAAAIITDPVTTTDELIPSGETSSYRSNPLGLAEFTLSRKDPAYVKRAKEIQRAEKARAKGENPAADNKSLAEALTKINSFLAESKQPEINMNETSVGSFIYAVKPGDGSAREQAASCQKVLGGLANIAGEYATKRYRSNLINWGMLPFVFDGSFDAEKPGFEMGDFVFIPDIAGAIKEKRKTITAYVADKGFKELKLTLGELTDDERDIILSGCLINYYKNE